MLLNAIILEPFQLRFKRNEKLKFSIVFTIRFGCFDLLSKVRKIISMYIDGTM
jgi:hypothetical protein